MCKTLGGYILDGRGNGVPSVKARPIGGPQSRTEGGDPWLGARRTRSFVDRALHPLCPLRACCLGIIPTHPPAPWGARLSEMPQCFLLPLPGAPRAEASVRAPPSTPCLQPPRLQPVGCACLRAHSLCRPGGHHWDWTQTGHPS